MSREFDPKHILHFAFAEQRRLPQSGHAGQMGFRRRQRHPNHEIAIHCPGIQAVKHFKSVAAIDSRHIQEPVECKLSLIAQGPHILQQRSG